MVGIHNSDMDFDEYYDDPNFEKLLVAAETLEIERDELTLDYYWQQIIESLPLLEQRYL